MGLLVGACALPVAPAEARYVHFGDRALHQGMQGRDVRVLQRYLTKVGIWTFVDGQYGPITASHVRRWESRASLPVDGRMSRTNAAALRAQVVQVASALQASNGGAAPVAPTAAVPGTATLTAGGLAVAPPDAPPAVQAVIAAGNRIVGKPYRYGGGHATWEDTGYDCSGSESYALHGGGLVSRPLDSTEFESWGASGPGVWITSYANSGHAYMVVAGLRFDTGWNDSASTGPKWSIVMRPSTGYVVRHPAGL